MSAKTPSETTAESTVMISIVMADGISAAAVDGRSGVWVMPWGTRGGGGRFLVSPLLGSEPRSRLGVKIQRQRRAEDCLAASPADKLEDTGSRS